MVPDNLPADGKREKAAEFMHKIGTRCFPSSHKFSMTGDTPRVCVGKGEKLRSNREKASVFSPIAPRFSELSGGFFEKRPFVRPEDGQRRA